MKVAILVLAIFALTASVAYAAPTENEDAEIEAFLNKLMKQEEVSEQDNRAAQMQFFLAQLQDDDEDEEADLQELFAREQAPAKVQWKIFKDAFKLGKHAFRFVKAHLWKRAVKN